MPTGYLHFLICPATRATGWRGVCYRMKSSLAGCTFTIARKYDGINTQVLELAPQIWDVLIPFEERVIPMTVSDIIDGILERKAALGATVQQISDASGVPKSTVDNILRKVVSNPQMQNVLDIANAVGYEFMPHEEKPVATADPTLQQIIYVYEKRCEALEKESRLKTVQSNLVIAEKDRTIADKNKWLARLFDSLVILAVGVMVVLLIDVCVRGIGWFP